MILQLKPGNPFILTNHTERFKSKCSFPLELNTMDKLELLLSRKISYPIKKFVRNLLSVFSLTTKNE